MSLTALLNSIISSLTWEDSIAEMSVKVSCANPTAQEMIVVMTTAMDSWEEAIMTAAALVKPLTTGWERKIFFSIGGNRR